MFKRSFPRPEIEYQKLPHLVQKVGLRTAESIHRSESCLCLSDASASPPDRGSSGDVKYISPLRGQFVCSSIMWDGRCSDGNDAFQAVISRWIYHSEQIWVRICSRAGVAPIVINTGLGVMTRMML